MTMGALNLRSQRTPSGTHHMTYRHRLRGFGTRTLTERQKTSGKFKATLHLKLGTRFSRVVAAVPVPPPGRMDTRFRFLNDGQ